MISIELDSERVWLSGQEQYVGFIRTCSYHHTFPSTSDVSWCPMVVLLFNAVLKHASDLPESICMLLGIHRIGLEVDSCLPGLA